MTKTLTAVISLILAAAIMMLGNSLLGIALPLKMTAAGYSVELTGVVMASYFAGLLTGGIYGKRLILEVGHIRAFAGLAAIMAAAVLAHALLFDPVSWALLRFLAGFCLAGLFAAVESWLNERSSNETRGQVLSVYMATYYAAILTGQLMINLWDLAGVEVFVMAAMMICLSLVPVALTRVKAPDLSAIKPLSFAALYRVSPLAVIGCVMSGLMSGSYFGVGAVFAREIGLEVFDVSLFMGSVVLGALLLQWPIGRASDRFDRRTVLLAMLTLTVLVSAGGISTAALSDPLPALLGLGVLLGGAITSIYPISVSQAFDYLPRDRYVAASGGLVLAYGLGATVGPLIAAFAMGALGPQAFFGYMGLVALGFGGFVLYRMQARRPVPAAQQEAFVALPRMSPVVAELDPRAGPDTGLDAAPDATPDAEEESGAAGHAKRVKMAGL